MTAWLGTEKRLIEIREIEKQGDGKLPAPNQYARASMAGCGCDAMSGGPHAARIEGARAAA